ncbi:histidinol-phosphate transaminase [Marinoscillum sp. MHG1-6]|uniref:histidinol-phosphate transaminase n=1 Tax=Marinoscillum sp. MHG1-6 TaxID=2959627 RepID=UPI00215828EF|nr:histidinol-phosphate transaminase [Marinoscillum sp. MHG1-6]
MGSPQQLIRNHIKTLKAYSSARDEYTGTLGIFLDANENSLGSSTSALYNRYPDPHHATLKAQWSEIKGVATDRIFFGNGSDEPIDLLLRLFCEPGKDHVITMPPTYGMYAVSADINAVENVKVPLKYDFQIDLATLKETWNENSKILFVCSPNNPSGNLLDRKTIQTILDEFPGMVVVDEAYIDFSSEESWTDKLAEYPNLIVLQTLSKAWGMAGIRVGVAMADPYVIEMLDKIKPPYNISLPNQQLATEALSNEAKKNAYVEELLEERTKLITALGQLPNVRKIVPSDANFLLVAFEGAKEVFNYLIEETLIVRDRSSQLHCTDCLRITIGTKEENLELMNLLKAYLEKSVSKL